MPDASSMRPRKLRLRAYWATARGVSDLVSLLEF